VKSVVELFAETSARLKRSSVDVKIIVACFMLLL
jgi:hypothetical protein